MRLCVACALPLLSLAGFTAYQTLKPAAVAAPVEPTAAKKDRPDKPGGSPTPTRLAYTKQVVPLVQKYCIKCHGGRKPRAGFALDRIKTERQADNDRKTWEKVVRALQAREMPPEDKPQPTAAERDLLLTFLDQRLAAIDCTKGRDPGRVTLRRLNRTEYNNTIRDLLGVDFRPAADFPADDVGYGFDNIGDVLSMSPLLMEKYLSAAERVVEQAIFTGTPGPAVRRYVRRELKATIDSPVGRRNFRALTGNGALYVNHRFPSNTEYTFRIRAYGDQAGNEPAKMALRLDGRDLKVFDVTAEVDRPRVYQFKARIKAGNHRIAAAFINDFYDPAIKDPKHRDRNLHVQFIEVQAPAAEALPASHRSLFIATPGDKLSKDEAARRILANFSRRAFRRPVTPQEVGRYLKLFKMADQQGEKFEQAIGVAVQGVLVSPHFLFRIEHDHPQGGIHPISEYELATRLSYFLWSSMPDEELFALAGKGDLRKNLDAQVRRLLKDDKAKALVDNFGGQWLQWRNLKTLNPDRKTFPAFDEQLRAAMVTEAELFFEAVVKEDRSVLDFLDANFTFLNDRLARHYGIDGVYGRRFRRVALKPDSPRGGVLTMASTLTVTSNPTRTSPVKRGKWILENILNAPPPPPPPDAGELSEEKKVTESAPLRQRMEMHRHRADCVSCHARMDPLGFALENFDGIGGWRSRDGKFPVDSAGTLPTGESFKGARELKSVLKKRSEAFSRCVAEKLLTYALGRGVEYYDKCTLDDIVAALKKNDYKFSRLVLEIVNSDPFQRRRTQGGSK